MHAPAEPKQFLTTFKEKLCMHLQSPNSITATWLTQWRAGFLCSVISVQRELDIGTSTGHVKPNDRITSKLTIGKNKKGIGNGHI
jgi:hypothetical protein